MESRKRGQCRAAKDLLERLDVETPAKLLSLAAVEETTCDVSGVGFGARRLGSSAVRAAVRRASGNDYAFVSPVAPPNRTDRFRTFVGFIPFAQRSVGRYDAETMRKPKSSQETRLIGAAEAFIETRLGLGHVAFSLEELTKESGLSAIAAKFQLLRLRGKVIRVSPRQPFYLIVSPEHRSMGAPPANWWLQEYFDWLGRPYYLALQSAASSFGSNPQALQVTQVMTDRPSRD